MHTTGPMLPRCPVSTRPRPRSRTHARPAPRPAVERFEPRVLFATFVVTTTADSGEGSLREAIILSNETAGLDDITFALGEGVATISPLSPLPAITDAVNLDAADPDTFAPTVHLDGSLAGEGADGLVIASTDEIFASFVTGLIITNFSGNGIRITGDSNGVGLSYIGTDPSGAPAGNGGAGILIEGDNNFVADTVIAFNAGDGVAVVGDATGNDVAINNFFSNGGLAIDLGDDGVTPNDPLDADAGPNTLQNFPVLDKPTFAAGAGVTVTGTIHTTPDTDVAIAFYTSPTADGEGSFQDHLTVHTDASGNATFTVTLAGAAETDFITATASSLVFGETFAINTSEFSAPVTAAVTAPPDDANNGLGNNPGRFDPGNPGRGHRRREDILALMQE